MDFDGIFTHGQWSNHVDPTGLWPDVCGKPPELRTGADRAGRMTLRRLGIQGRALMVMTATLLLVGAIVGLLLSRQGVMQAEVRTLGEAVVGQFYTQTARDLGQQMAADLAGALAEPMAGNDHDRIDALLRTVSAQQSVAHVELLDADGDVLRAYRAEDLATDGEDAHLLDVTLPVTVEGRIVGTLRLGTAAGMVDAQRVAAGERLEQGISKLGQRHLYAAVALLAMLGLVAVTVTVYVQRTLVRPIRSLAEAAHSIEEGDYAVDLSQVHASGEMGDLVRVFRRMSQAIVRHDREVRQLAYTDALTGLTNRLSFREQLEQRVSLAATTDGAQLALLFVDVDDFKRVNDTLGHEVGDDVLLLFVERIRVAVEACGGDDEILLARFGGDEFVILVGGDEVIARATRLGETLVAELARPLMLEGREVFLGSSIGITLFPDDADDASGLLKNGDIAMYQAKAAGKNCFRYYSRAMDHAVERQLHVEHELRGAWERGELHLAFQPIYRLRDRRLVGAETLLRWQHPQMGVIPPSVFIPIAERSGLIEQLGPKVLRAACLEARRWTQQPGGEQMFVSVNVSPRQLRTGDLAEIVVQCLKESGLAPSRLHIELTETAVIGDEILAATLLDKLHRNGVKVWLDDFGTGFSGLSHLRQVPVDGVKIDKSFVADMQMDPDDLALTTAIIAMCHALGITVVAEGIEQEAQYNLLAQRGCDLAQGYLMSRPLTSSQLTALLKQQV